MSAVSSFTICLEQQTWAEGQPKNLIVFFVRFFPLDYGPDWGDRGYPLAPPIYAGHHHKPLGASNTRTLRWLQAQRIADRCIHGRR